MTNTLHLGLPFIEGSQAQKHVTHNEALRILDAIVQIGVLDADRTAPPLTPAEGDRHIVASGATGAWAGQAKAIALYEDGGWRFLAPRPGWCAWSAADGVLLVYDGTAWSEVAGGGGGGTGDSVAKLGVNDTATAPNLLTVRSSDALFHAIAAADGGSGNMRLQIAKEGAANTASVFFSDAYSGHAEFGLTGDNDFHLKVSADGATWRDAVKFDRTTGRASFPGGGVRELLTANRTYYVRTDGNDNNDGLSNTTTGAFKTLTRAQLACQSIDCAGYGVTIQVADGTYTAGWIQTSAMLGCVFLQIVGNSATPANCIISASSSSCFSFSCAQSSISINGFTVTNSAGNALTSVGAVVTFSNVVFGTCSSIHIYAASSGSLSANSNYSIAGAAQRHYEAIYGGVINVTGRTVTLSGSQAYAVAFAYAERLGYLNTWGNTYTGGTITGQRYVSITYGVIDTNGGGASYFPGSSAGSAMTGLYL